MSYFLKGGSKSEFQRITLLSNYMGNLEGLLRELSKDNICLEFGH